MKVIKFGGKSLGNGAPLENALQIINRLSFTTKLVVVCSARGTTTNQLEDLLEAAASGNDFEEGFQAFCEYQMASSSSVDFKEEFTEIHRILEGVALLQEYSLKVKDRVLSFGELLSCKTVSALLQEQGKTTRLVDTRKLLKTDNEFGSAQVLLEESEANVKAFFKDFDPATIEVATGFIASNIQNQTTTLGRNGSNYSATLLANFLNAEEVQNWTNVNGVYTANPSLVSEAQIIPSLSYREANEMANFGTNILHAKTILPLIEKEIPIKILNSFDPESTGTTIDKDGSGKGLKAISVIDNVALVSIEGRGLLGKVGIDARIFTALGAAGVSVRIISQASSERGIGFIVDQENAKLSKKVLEKEFTPEIVQNDISHIGVDKEVAVISVIGRHFNFLDQAYSGLRKNNIRPYLINNTINGEHLSLVVKSEDLNKAANVIHSHLFGVSKKLNVILFGKGTVGNALINQIIATQDRILERRDLNINIVAIADSQKVLLNAQGIKGDWRSDLEEKGVPYQVRDLFDFVATHHLENVVAVDNTASQAFVQNYQDFVDNGFDLVASNKIGNTISYEFYETLRDKLRLGGKQFFYETNVGAGLPLLDTIKLLHHSGDKIKRIRGVFSGSLSYIFNTFSESEEPFSEILGQAMDKGFTEPDPREDLSGNDVARKLLILAREIDMKNEFSDVVIENLIPPVLREIEGVDEFVSKTEEIDTYYKVKKSELAQDEVLRYTGDLSADGSLEVKLVGVDKNTSLGGIKGSDSIFEIYTEAYGNNPLVIQGAGAGAEVTARGVYGDLLRLGESL